MARIISVPDVHGSHEWEVIKTIPWDSYDYIVFHGDYFDSWENKWPDQGENFESICLFVREDTEHRKLLLGNHDWSYITGTETGSCSGHQNGRIREIRNLLTKNLDIIDLAFECDGWVFSHAGFSATWVESILKVFHQMLDKWPDDEEAESPELVWDEKEFSINFLNEQWHKLSHVRGEPNFWEPFDELLDWYGFFSGSGDEISQGPLWIRPNSLLKDAYYRNQVAGHTEFCIYDKIYLQQNENRIVLIDSPFHEVYGIFDTRSDYAFLSFEDFFKLRKKTVKTVNDIKSQIIYHKDIEGFIRKELNEHFTEKEAAKLLKIAFSEYLEE